VTRGGIKIKEKGGNKGINRGRGDIDRRAPGIRDDTALITSHITLAPGAAIIGGTRGTSPQTPVPHHSEEITATDWRCQRNNHKLAIANVVTMMNKFMPQNVLVLEQNRFDRVQTMKLLKS